MTDTVSKLAAAGRRVLSGLGLLFAVLAAFPSHSPAAPASHRLATVQRAEADRVVFRVKVPDARLVPGRALKDTERIEIDGYSRLGDPGAPPTLTRTFLVGLPADGAYTLTYRLISSTPLGTHRLEPVATPIGIHDDELGPGISERVQWNDEVFQAYRDPALVSSDAVVYVRHQRALPVRVNPVAYDPRTQTLSVAKEIEIEVRFARAPRRVDDSAGLITDEGKDWNDIYGRLIVNASQARPWRTKTPSVSNLTAGAARVVPGAVKIRVYQTGMHSVLASRIIAAGFPAGQPVANLRLFRRSYSETTLSANETEIACEVNESVAGTPGVFDGNDELVFYGRRLRDDPNQPDAKEQFSSYNVYWLEPSNGARMAQSTPGVGFVTGDTLSATFPAQDHFEIDNIFRDKTKAGLPGPEDLYYYNAGEESGPVDMPFAVGNIQPGTSLSLASELHGQTYEQPRSIRVSLNNSHGDQVLNASYPIPGKMRRVFRATIPAANLDLGTNELRLSKPDVRPSLQVLLNWVEVSYNSLYRARGNTLRFNSAALAGDTTIAVTGITSTSGLALLDITNPDQPGRLVLSAGHFKPATGGSVLAFRENFGSRRQYILIPDARMIDVKAVDVVADTPSTIIGGSAESGIDVLTVAHHDFVAQMREWASYRRAQGYRVLLVDADDVFDEFNGGIPSARAIFTNMPMRPRWYWWETRARITSTFTTIPGPISYPPSRASTA